MINNNTRPTMNSEIERLRQVNADLRIENAKLIQRINTLLKLLHKLGEYANLELEKEVRSVQSAEAGKL